MHAAGVDVKAKLVHLPGCGRDKFVFQEAGGEDPPLQVAEKEVAGVKAPLDGEADACLRLGHQVIVHEGGVVHGRGETRG